MDETWLRLGLVVVVFASAAGLAFALRRRAAGKPNEIDASGLEVGVYLFSSASCLDCDAARRVLEAAVGDDGFTEVRWESDPELFQEIGIGAVPATVIVEGGGRGTLYPGQPEKAAKALSP